MNEPSLRAKALILGFSITVAVGGLVVFTLLNLRQSKEEILRNTSKHTSLAAYELAEAANHLVDSLWHATLYRSPKLTVDEQKRIDSILTKITREHLLMFNGIEGGYYFNTVDLFAGFAFPTEKHPQPAYGPPPREFNTIRAQVLNSIAQQQKIVAVCQFEQTTFPLATEPLMVRGKVVGAVWTMMRVESLLPLQRLTNTLNVVAIASLLGVIIAILVSWVLRKRVEEIKIGLDTLRRDDTFRFRRQRGVLGSITGAMNEMVEAKATEQRKKNELEQELQQRAKMAAMGNLVAGVAHEVKTPLATIRTRIEMWQRKLRQKNGAESAGEVISEDSMNMVITEIDRLTNLVKRLLVFSKPVATNFRPSNLHQVVAQALALIQYRADEAHIDIATHFDSHTPLIQIDPEGIEQVMLNVCTNALEAMSHGGELQVITEYLPDQCEVAISVKDTGSGISQEVADKLFDPFFTTKEQGAGLGLSIAYEVVQAHRGNIRFILPQQRGSLCRITLPATNGSSHHTP
jgi:signal transduction histidine kinase